MNLKLYTNVLQQLTSSSVQINFRQLEYGQMVDHSYLNSEGMTVKKKIAADLGIELDA